MRKLWALIVLAGSVAACSARAEVRVPAGAPVLEPATPPARVIVPAPERPTLPTEEPPAAPVSGAPARQRETPPPARQAAPPANPPATPDPPPPSVLSTTANTADFERRIRAQMARAQTDLGAINRMSLGPDARAQFDAAQGFLRQCDEALKVRNLVFAGQLADKAATLAAQLRKSTSVV